MSDAPHLLTAAELAALYRRRAASPVEVTRAALAHIASWEPHLRAAYALDPEAALAQAAAAEARWLRGEPQGPLDGVPAMLKENIATRGVPVPLGTAATELRPAAEDAPPAARLREAGTVLLGKTTMPDYGMLSSGLSSFHPLTRNPWQLDRNPGGSSSGAAAAAAAGYAPLHVGTDIGGSIRLPAGWCGLFGLKPSLGRIPIDPPYPARVAGPMTRTVRDAALMMQALTLPDWRDHMSLPYERIDWLQLERPLRGLRIGLWLDAGWGTAVAGEVAEAVCSAARAFEAAGAIVEPLAPWADRSVIEGIDRFWRTRFWIEMSRLPEERRARVLPFIRAWAEGGAEHSGEAVFQGYSETLNLRAATVAATRHFDYVLSPTAPMPAFAAELPCPTDDVTRPFDHIAFTLAFNMSEQPAASINCGYTGDGLPIGLQIAGRRFDDLGVLQMAQAWEQMRPAQRPWPAPPGALG
ncbi:amidase [Eleftheria terrae]|uniref:amidase n=1 Tax=Eleftheria terrae TaxID=1597781 RepID=UPI00263AA411|nr:amidase [Eleftheria terrae]WKB51398.1 amidase [Eleftheria terrae]